MNKLNALVVDNDYEIRHLLVDFLQQHDFTVSQANNTEEADKQIAKQKPDVILLDLKMPGEDGISYCRRIREGFNKPIIMLTATEDEIEQIIAFEVGVDVYLTKPFNVRILLAKIKSVLRRYQVSIQLLESMILEQQPQMGLTYEFLGWSLNIANRVFTSPDELLITLSSAEYNLLLALVEHPNRVLTREQLLDYTQDDDCNAFDRSIDVLISRLRHKFNHCNRDERIIKTIRGGGYMFTPKITKKQTLLKSQ